ncbi:glycosyltransferase [Nitrososphaera sp.]|uniref:glycosyltransferase n=1 Tax=Nitrososphaera sp. TaxID=1971748 RepID=UPI00317E16D9
MSSPAATSIVTRNVLPTAEVGTELGEALGRVSSTVKALALWNGTNITARIIPATAIPIICLYFASFARLEPIFSLGRTEKGNIKGFLSPKREKSFCSSYSNAYIQVRVVVIHSMQTGMVATQQAANESGSISIVIPVYNQEENVIKALERIGCVLDAAFVDYELVVVNDGSTDRTLEVLKKEELSNQKLRVVSYARNRGKGFAVKTGVLESRGNAIIFTDGDLDISPEIISDYIKELESSDLVIASKLHPSSKVKAPFSRRFLSRAFNLLVRMAVGIKVKDTQSGLKAGNGDVLRTIFKVMLVKRYAFDVELLTIAATLDLKIKELPIEINLGRRFKIRDVARMFVDVMGISYRYRVRRWYQKQLQQLQLGR